MFTYVIVTFVEFVKSFSLSTVTEKKWETQGQFKVKRVLIWKTAKLHRGNYVKSVYVDNTHTTPSLPTTYV